MRQYLDFHSLALEAIGAYRADVLQGEFPSDAESYQVGRRRAKASRESGAQAMR